MRGIVIFTDDPGWHGARLKEAFAARGVDARFVSLKQCRFEFTRPGHGIVIPGFEERLPDGAFVRGVPGGTLEQVVLRLDVLHALKEAGVPVYNDGRAVERTVDKAMTSFVLAHAGIPTPDTWVVESEPEARAIAMREAAGGQELVVKPLFGSRGVGLKRIAAANDLPAAGEYSGAWYLQRYVPPSHDGWLDWRVFVIGGRAIAAMARRGKTWINNVAQGARCEAVDLARAPELAALAQRACRALAMDYAGVDLIRDRAGRMLVLEVNGIPAWKGLQSVSSIDIAQCLADDFLRRHCLRAAPRSAA